ncbi:unnamed protein product [Pleuronectes platessa]|uniref:Uncharacterized protein n=1 Tax=Pleuronectes platessa TaxID=8262 RepID=A0A9N7VXA3_PLEPL|nr:unnamed protein product [Pleuronectes platessa]
MTDEPRSTKDIGTQKRDGGETGGLKVLGRKGDKDGKKGSMQDRERAGELELTPCKKGRVAVVFKYTDVLLVGSREFNGISSSAECACSSQATTIHPPSPALPTSPCYQIADPADVDCHISETQNNNNNPTHSSRNLQPNGGLTVAPGRHSNNSLALSSLLKVEEYKLEGVEEEDEEEALAQIKDWWEPTSSYLAPPAKGLFAF